MNMRRYRRWLGSAAASDSQSATVVSTIWSPLELVAFRVAFVYFLIDTLPRLVYYLPGGRLLTPIDAPVWRPVVPWVAKHILHLSREIKALGGYDTAYGYVLALCRLATALILGAVWTGLDTKRRNYSGLHYWLRLLLRYEVAVSTLAYGTAKVFQQQFPTPDLTALIRPLGMQNPHTLLWNFMGFSRTYQVFTGSVECLGALLLFFRRTTTVGAFILIAAMANVVVMDLSYGTFVKMIALHLLLASAFLTIPDLRRLAKALLLRQSAWDTAGDGPKWSKLGRQQLLAAAKGALLIYLVSVPSLHAYRTSKTLASVESKPPLYGLYSVERFARGGHEVPNSDPHRWNLVALDGLAKGYTQIAVRFSDETWQCLRTEYDESAQAMTIETPSGKAYFSYMRTQDGVVLRGPLNGGAVEVSLHRFPDPKFPLNDPEGVRWVAGW